MSNRTLPQITVNLIKAKKVIQEEENWCKGHYYQYNWTNHKDQHCALGALYRTIGDILTSRESRILSDALYPRMSGVVHHYNDLASTTHADIMALYDKAITLSMKGM